MTQRFQKGSNNLNYGTVCEKYITRLLTREKQTAAALSTLNRGRDKTVKNRFPHSQNQLIKAQSNLKQQNILSPQHRSLSQNKLQYSEDSALVEVTVKTMNPRQRSSSTAADRESWGQLLKQQKNGDKMSMFGNFDPLRTLHFLAKELQLQLQSVLPDDGTVHQMVADMQYALKRIPPEVASSVHLQQARDTMPRKISSKTSVEKPEKLTLPTFDCGVQTVPLKAFEYNDQLQQIMEDGTLKLENSFKYMEKVCTELKNEKNKLEKELLEFKKNNNILHKKIEDLELENNEILSLRIKILEDEKRKLETKLRTVAAKLETVSQHACNDLKSQIIELRTQKDALYEKCNKLIHSLKLCALEREKFVAVLALRDAQINEIRSEMSQLQQMVNEQLIEANNSAFLNMPTVENNEKVAIFDKAEHPEINGISGDGTMSTMEEHGSGYYTPKQNISFKDLQSGDTDVSNVFPEDSETNLKYTVNPLLANSAVQLEEVDSQTSIRMMFNQMKNTAYAVAGDTNGGSQYN